MRDRKQRGEPEMLGWELQEVYPVVPIPDDHAVSIGLTTIEQPGVLRSGESIDDLPALT
jgi:hypothetical protein